MPLISEEKVEEIKTITFTDIPKGVTQCVNAEVFIDKIKSILEEKQYPQLSVMVDLLLSMQKKEEIQFLANRLSKDLDVDSRTRLMSVLINKSLKEEGNVFLRANNTLHKTFMKCEAEEWLVNELEVKIAPHLNDFIKHINSELKTTDYSEQELEPSGELVYKFKDITEGIFTTILSVHLDDHILRNCYYIAKHASEKIQKETQDKVEEEIQEATEEETQKKTEQEIQDKINGYIVGYLILSIINPAISAFLKDKESYNSFTDAEHVTTLLHNCSLFGEGIIQKAIQKLFNKTKLEPFCENTSVFWKYEWSTLSSYVIGQFAERASSFIERTKNAKFFEDIRSYERDEGQQIELLQTMHAEHVENPNDKPDGPESKKSEINRKNDEAAEQKKAEEKAKELDAFIKLIKHNPDDALKKLKQLKKDKTDENEFRHFFNMYNSNGETPIGTAIEHNRTTIAKKMFGALGVRKSFKKRKAHTNPNLYHKGESILYISVVNGSDAIFNILMNNPKVIIDLQNADTEFTPLMGAIQHNRYKYLSKLLMHKRQKNSALSGMMDKHKLEVEINGKTIFLKAVEEYADEETLKALIEHTSRKKLIKLIGTRCKKDNATPIVSALRNNRAGHAAQLMEFIVKKSGLPIIEENKRVMLFKSLYEKLKPELKACFEKQHGSCSKKFDEDTFKNKYYNRQFIPFLKYISSYITQETPTDEKITLMQGLQSIAQNMLDLLDGCYKESKKAGFFRLTLTDALAAINETLETIQTIQTESPNQETLKVGIPDDFAKYGMTTFGSWCNEQQQPAKEAYEPFQPVEGNRP